jgi:hypothetical protein
MLAADEENLMNPETGMTELLSVPAQYCYVCCLHAVLKGLDWNDMSGNTLSDGSMLHEPVTSVAGTPICWYHVGHINRPHDLLNHEGTLELQQSAAHGKPDQGDRIVPGSQRIEGL